MNNNRSPEFQRNEKLEIYLNEINEKLRTIQGPEINSIDWPIIFIVGVPRCGSTLLLQLLANNDFSYPSNIVARFYENPYIGALIQKVLAEEDNNSQIGVPKKIDYNSKLGRTKGGLNVSEFWYYWRRFFNFEEIHKLDKEELKNVDTEEFKNGLYQLVDLYQQPLALKAMILNWHLDYLAKLIDNSVFIFIKRELQYIAQSLLISRKKFFNNYEKWYSFKPPEYEWLKDLSPVKQVAGQAYYTEKAVQEGIDEIKPGRTLTINYRNICESPGTVIRQILEQLDTHRSKDNFEYKGPEHFAPSREIKINQNKFDEIDKYLKELGYE